MQKRRFWECAAIVLFAVSATLSGTGTVFALTSTSPNYQLVETEFNAGSAQDTCSSSYCARVSIGGISGDKGESVSYHVAFGPITPDTPTLEVIVEPGESNLGQLTTEQTASKTMVVKVRNYLSKGYVLQIMGDPPKAAGHTLLTPSTPTASLPGTEQFAINAVANTVPVVGANLVQVPSGDFSFGSVSADYATPNLFKYASGDTVARSLKSSGRTDYTISMIVNISNKTPAGNYAGDYSAVVVPLY